MLCSGPLDDISRNLRRLENLSMIATRNLKQQNVCECIYQAPPPQRGCDTRPILLWSPASFNLEFPFS